MENAISTLRVPFYYPITTLLLPFSFPYNAANITQQTYYELKCVQIQVVAFGRNLLRLPNTTTFDYYRS